ncbi:hypothetical protein SKAU_G00325230 [Synaphobranchus kaupii]|uniref:DDE Tnp4 domain-containing protein n=1 Tax=Synaphobranchus kaupii TaxID=118154 RepID=A0A9Q1EPK3_SYNKA|nr:hypothetical protein SKAU_G00325230 [Synaphobranchus kaupii]
MYAAVSQQGVLHHHANLGPYNTARLITFLDTLHGILIPAEQRGGPEQPRVKPPGEPECQFFLNRKLFPSVKIQAVCDRTGKSLNVILGSPGSVHDSHILKNSPVYIRGLYPPPGGDGGYPCLQEPICLVTSYRDPVIGSGELV